MPAETNNTSTQNIDENDYRYDAFISYRHVEQDRKWAKWLHTNLETFKVPKKLQTQLGLAKGLSRVFRDEEELPVSSSLSEQIQQALEQSRFLIVICSKETPASRWVNQEIVSFREMGRHDRIVALLIDGEPDESFPTALREIRTRLVEPGSNTEREQVEEIEPLAADVRSTRSDNPATLKKMALLRIMAMLLGCRFDDLRQRHQERSVQRLKIIVSAALLLVALMAGLSVFAWTKKQQAERNYLAAKTAADSLFEDVAREISNLEGIRPETTRKVLTKVNDIYEKLLKETNNDIEILGAKAAALAVFATTYLSKNDFENAVISSDQGVEIFQTLIDLQPQNPKWKERHALLRMFQLGSFYIEGKDFDPQELISLRQTLLDDFESLEKSGHKSLDLYQALATLGIESSAGSTVAGDHQIAVEKLNQAMAYINKAKELPDAGEDTRVELIEAIANAQLSEKYQTVGNLEAALFAAEAAYDYYNKILTQKPDTAGIRQNTANVLRNIADLSRLLGDTDSAESKLRLAYLAEFGEVDWASTDPEDFREAADNALERASNSFDAEEMENALDWYRLSAAYYEKMLVLGTLDSTVQFQFLHCLFRLERFHQDNPELRLSAVQHSLSQIELGLSRFPETSVYHGQAYARNGQALTTLGRFDEAIDSYNSGIAIFKPQLESKPGDKQLLEMLGLLNFDLAMVEQKLHHKDLGKSIDSLLQSLNYYRQAMKIDVEFAVDVAMVNKFLALAGNQSELRWAEIITLLESFDPAVLSDTYKLLLQEARQAL